MGVVCSWGQKLKQVVAILTSEKTWIFWECLV
jgi:hypothetical protein